MNSRHQDNGILRLTHDIAAADNQGLALHVRQARPRSPARGTVVLVHGATLASGLWDIQVPGYSILDALAAAGFSAWAPDLRGYARSQRLQNPDRPYSGRDEAVLDIAATVEHACRSDGTSRVVLVGGSWGSITTAIFASRHPGRVGALALMAPIFANVNSGWLRDLADPHDRTRRREPRAATRKIDGHGLRTRWDEEVVFGDPLSRRDPLVLDALLSDALQAEEQPCDAFTVPNGTLDDLFEAFSGRPLYDPSKLAMPVLLVRGEHDATSTDDDARRLFAALGSRDKIYLQVGGSGHFLCAERQAGFFRTALIDFCFANAGADPL
ncbi:MAG: alpha/beta hydrolase [Burkholderiaceae bacterium]